MIPVCDQPSAVIYVADMYNSNAALQQMNQNTLMAATVLDEENKSSKNSDSSNHKDSEPDCSPEFLFILTIVIICMMKVW